jgi:hypothetical protein
MQSPVFLRPAPSRAPPHVRGRRSSESCGSRGTFFLPLTVILIKAIMLRASVSSAERRRAPCDSLSAWRVWDLEPSAPRLRAADTPALGMADAVDRLIPMLERALCRARGGAVGLWRAASAVTRCRSRSYIEIQHKGRSHGCHERPSTGPTAPYPRANAPVRRFFVFRRALARSAPESASGSACITPRVHVGLTSSGDRAPTAGLHPSPGRPRLDAAPLRGAQPR